MSKVVKKLKAIRRLVKNIPSKNIDLDLFVTKDGDTYKKSVMCPAAWITTDVFVGKDLELIQVTAESWKVVYKDDEDFVALAKFLNIHTEEAQDLFGPTLTSETWDFKSHKKIFLERISNLIKEYR